MSKRTPITKFTHISKPIFANFSFLFYSISRLLKWFIWTSIILRVIFKLKICSYSDWRYLIISISWRKCRSCNVITILWWWNEWFNIWAKLRLVFIWKITRCWMNNFGVNALSLTGICWEWSSLNFWISNWSFIRCNMRNYIKLIQWLWWILT